MKPAVPKTANGYLTARDKQEPAQRKLCRVLPRRLLYPSIGVLWTSLSALAPAGAKSNTHVTKWNESSETRQALQSNKSEKYWTGKTWGGYNLRMANRVQEQDALGGTDDAAQTGDSGNID
jgi:hypothetical protein